MPSGEPVRTAHFDIHDDNFALNQEASKQQIPPPPQQRDHASNSHTEVEEAICNAAGTEESVAAVPVVPVRLKSAESEVLTYAMLDSCSTGSFILDDIAAILKVKGVNTQLMVKPVNGTKLHDSKVLNGLVVTDLNGDHCYKFRFS